MEFKTVDGQVVKIQTFQAGACRHKRIVPRETFSEWDLYVAQCDGCKFKFTAERAKRWMEAQKCS